MFHINLMRIELYIWKGDSTTIPIKPKIAAWGHSQLDSRRSTQECPKPMKEGIIWDMLCISYCKSQPQVRFTGNELHYLLWLKNEHVFACNICSITVLGMGVRYRDGKCQKHSFCFWRSLIYLLFFKVLQYFPAFNHEQPELSCYWLILLDVHCPYWQAVHVDIF